MLRIAGGMAIALMTLALSVTAFTLYDRFSLTNSRRTENARAWHLVLCLAETKTLLDKKLTPKDKLAAINFYDEALSLVGAVPCAYTLPKPKEGKNG